MTNFIDKKLSLNLNKVGKEVKKVDLIIMNTDTPSQPNKKTNNYVSCKQPIIPHQ